MSLSKAVLSRASAPHAWCVRSGDGGGLKLTYSKYVTGSMVTDQKKAFKGIAPTARTGSTIASYGDKKSQGVEVQIIEWTISDGIVYVSDGTKIYRLLLSKAHGKRVDSYDNLIRQLSQRTARVFV
jgi:hypothetical protein